MGAPKPIDYFTSATIWATKLTPLPRRLEMMFSSPTKAPERTKRMLLVSTTKVSPLETACQHCFIGIRTSWATAVTREAFTDTLLRPRCCTEAAVHGVVGIPRGWVVGVRVGLGLRATWSGGRRGRRRRSIRADRRVLGRDRHTGSLEDAKQRLLNTLTTYVAPASPSAKLVPATPSELVDFVNVNDAHPVSSVKKQ